MVSSPTGTDKDHVSLPRELDGIQNILEELKSKGLIDRDVKAIKKSSRMSGFKASTLWKTRIFYNGDYANLDDDSLRFILLHEDGHHRNKQNSRLLIGMVLAVIASSALLTDYYAAVSGSSPLPVLYGLLPFYFAFAFLSIRILQDPLQEDEYASDLYAAAVLMERYGVREPSKVVDRALRSVTSSAKPSSLTKRVSHLLFGGIHPTNKERVAYVRGCLEEQVK